MSNRQREKATAFFFHYLAFGKPFLILPGSVPLPKPMNTPLSSGGDQVRIAVTSNASLIVLSQQAILKSDREGVSA